MLSFCSAQLSLVVASSLLLSAAACAPETQDVAAAESSTALALSAAGTAAEPAADAGAPQTIESAWDYFLELRRLAWWRWHRRWHPTQNDGDQDAGTPVEDDANTPGDDRAGFVSCPGGDDAALVCSPEQRCCRSPLITCDSIEQDCQRPDVTVGWGDNCDGPEDCEAGLTCVRGKYGASCTPPNPQQGYPVLCHATTDCVFLPESYCREDGVCAKF
jgi:hypothetical protein